MYTASYIRAASVCGDKPVSAAPALPGLPALPASSQGKLLLGSKAQLFTSFLPALEDPNVCNGVLETGICPLEVCFWGIKLDSHLTSHYSP